MKLIFDIGELEILNKQLSVIAVNTAPCILEDSDEEPNKCVHREPVPCKPTEKCIGKRIAHYMRYRNSIFTLLDPVDTRPAFMTGGNVNICGFWIKINLPEIELTKRADETASAKGGHHQNIISLTEPVTPEPVPR